MNSNTNDLWQDFIEDTDAKSGKKRAVTDGSQWEGQYDRRAKPRRETPGDEQE